MQLLKQAEQITNNLTGDVKKFYYFHGIQMMASKFPVNLIEQLYQKLTSQTYDVGESFNIMDNEDRSTFEVHALKDMKKEQNIWILDHLMSFRYPDLRKVLESNKDVRQRIKEMTKYLDEKRQLGDLKPEQSQDLSVEFDSQQLTSVASLGIPKQTVCLSLVQNNLQHPQQIKQLIQQLPDLKILWIMDNPIANDQDLQHFVLTNTKIEIFNSKLTKNATTWALKYLIHKRIDRTLQTKDQQVYCLDLSGRQIFNINLDLLNNFPNLHLIKLYDTEINKDQQEKLLRLLSISSLRQVKCDYLQEVQIFELYKTQIGNKTISKKLLINDHNIFMPVPTEQQIQIDVLHKRLFKLSNCYRLASSQKLDETSIWYMNDEVGSAITHSDKPQCMIAPFLYAPNNALDDKVVAYTLMWLIQDVKQNDLVERDYLNGLGQDKGRSSRLAVWYNLPRKLYLRLYQEYDNNMQKIAQQFKPEKSQKQNEGIQVKEKYKYYTNNSLIKQFLTLKQFEYSENLEQIDILWMDNDVKQQEQIIKLQKRGVIFNQFNSEKYIVCKDNLANTIQSTIGTTKFLQRTYNLETEIHIFIGHFYDNEDKGVDNLWISKPPNMARSLDMIVSNNLEILLRNMETGPKIVQKYITNPVKRMNRKIDLRFIVAAKSILPLQVFIYKHFWIRTSNNEYNIDCRFRQEYQTHFTVMNYGKKLTQVNYPQFIEQFNKDYYPISWSAIYVKIKQLLKQTFIAYQPRYLNMQSDNARAIYGVDIMIDEQTMEPKLLQFTFSPDCNRACKFYPTFYNDIFQVLYLNRKNENMEILL